MVAYWTKWADDYPIVSVEDGMAEGDWDGLRAAQMAKARSAGSGPGLDRQ